VDFIILGYSYVFTSDLFLPEHYAAAPCLHIQDVSSAHALWISWSSWSVVAYTDNVLLFVYVYSLLCPLVTNISKTMTFVENYWKLKKCLTKLLLNLVGKKPTYS